MQQASHHLYCSGLCCCWRPIKPLVVNDDADDDSDSWPWPNAANEPVPNPFDCDAWDADTISAYSIVIMGENAPCSVVLLCGRAPRFNYQLKVEEYVLQLQRRTLTWHPDWSSITGAFHMMLLGDEPSMMCRVAVLAEGGLDIAGMRAVASHGRPAPTPPPWLEPLRNRCRQLLLLDALSSLCVPLAPMPNPIRLEAAFSAYEEDTEPLRLVGREVLHLLACMAAFTTRPFDDAEAVQSAALCFTRRARLANVVAQSGLLMYADAHFVSREAAAGICEALVGAAFCEPGGSFASAAGVWHWLRNLQAAEQLPNELAPALAHLGGARRPYLGRTPTYSELTELELEDGIMALQVKYIDIGLAQYRLCGARGQELRLDVPGASWQSIEFDRKAETFVSPSLVNEDGSCRPLPNKVCSFLRRQPLAALTNKPKRQDTNTMTYTALRELRGGTLEVHYVKHGLRRYRRRWSGSLGTEIDADDVERHLVYSEEKKALISPSISGSEIPNKVAEWVQCKLVNLADLAVASRSSRKPDEGVDDTVTSDDVASFTSQQGVKYTLCLTNADVGIAYVAIKENGPPAGEELVYRADVKKWMTCDECFLPPHAAEWLRKHSRSLQGTRMGNAVLKGWLEKHCVAPWINAPAFVAARLPRVGGTDVAKVQASLRHCFRNPMLLAQALTHPSRADAMTPSYQCLAAIGTAVLELEVSKKLLGVGCTSSRAANFAVSADMQWPPIDPQSTDAGHAKETAPCPFAQVQQSKTAYCSHVSYANTCVLLNLHETLLDSSEELVTRVREFAELVRSRCGWNRLFRHGAPRALGDSFLACVGAVAVDGAAQPTDVEQLADMHLEHCKGAERVCLDGLVQAQKVSAGSCSADDGVKGSVPSVAAPSPPPPSSEGASASAGAQTAVQRMMPEEKRVADDGKAYTYAEFVCHYGEREAKAKWAEGLIVLSALVPPPPPPFPEGASASAGAQHAAEQQQIGHVRFVQVCEPAGAGTSPRSPLLCAALGVGSSDAHIPEPVEGDVEEQCNMLDNATSTGTAGSERGPFYCDACNKQLNGPRQLVDHKLGKTHSKNMMKITVGKKHMNNDAGF